MPKAAVGIDIFSLALVVAICLFSAGQVWAAPPGREATYTYTRGLKAQPTVVLRADDGRLFSVTTDDNFGDGSFIDLIVRRVNGIHTGEGRNLLEPPGNWHGLWGWMFRAGDFQSDPPEYYGRDRVLPLRNYPYSLHVDVVREDLECGDASKDDNAAFCSFQLKLEIQKKEPSDKG